MKYTVFFLFFYCSVKIYGTKIEENEYKGISISFSQKIKQESIDFKKLKAVLQKASEYLYQATRKRSYFGDFILSLPPSWTLDKEMCEKATDFPEGIDIYITDSLQDPVLKAQHSRGCGSKGDLIYMSPNWLQGYPEDLAHQLVQQWAIYRYGVFEEKTNIPGSCFFYRKSWFPAGCYNVQLDMQPTLNKLGLPVCDLPRKFFENEELKSSIMFATNSSQVLNFCDGTSEFPHNAVMPTLHNRLCQGKTTWSVIKNSSDFKYGKNPPRENNHVPKFPSFRCSYEHPLHVTLAVQTGAIQDISQDLTEIRYILFRFLRNVAPLESEVNLVTFWSPPEAGNPVKLNLRNESQLDAILDLRIRKFSVGSDVCVSCGLQNAYNASLLNGHPFPTVVLIAWESSLATEKESDMIDLIKKNKNVILYLILVEDSSSDAVSSGLMTAVESGGGQIVKLTNEMLSRPSQLSVTLANAFKSPVRVEDQIIIVHDKVYVEVRSDFTDSFKIPTNATGKLIYMMHCSMKDDIHSDGADCRTNWGDSSITCARAEVVDLNGEISSEAFTYQYKYKGITDPLMCSSLAIMKLSLPVGSFTLRGWLSENQITPGHNVLIIYAEVLSSSKQEAEVMARVSGPGLKEPVKIELRDNGNGDPDVQKGDSIYSRYFTSFQEKGTYTVTVSAVVKEKQDEKLTHGSKENNEVKLVQTKAIGVFSVLEAMPILDILPPNRIADFTVISVDHENRTATLSWTAPGDDYDSGTASECKVYITKEWKDLQDDMLEKVHLNILDADGFFCPNPAGIVETQQFQLPNGSLHSTYYMAINCADKSNNKGRISNIIQVLTNIGNDLNISRKNDSENSTETSTDSNLISDYDKNTYFKSFILILGISSTILLLIILTNIIIWITCFKKYKQFPNTNNINDNSENDPKILATHSKEITFKNEYDTRHAYSNHVINERCVPQTRDTENSDKPLTSVAYAKVYKEEIKRDKTTLTTQKDRVKVLNRNTGHCENDLGYV